MSHDRTVRAVMTNNEIKVSYAVILVGSTPFNRRPYGTYIVVQRPPTNEKKRSSNGAKCILATYNDAQRYC